MIISLTELNSSLELTPQEAEVVRVLLLYVVTGVSKGSFLLSTPHDTIPGLSEVLKDSPEALSERAVLKIRLLLVKIGFLADIQR